MCFFAVTKVRTQSTFQCKCSSIDVKLCLKSEDNVIATKKAEEIYKVFKTGLQQGFEALRPCNKISTFVAYYDATTETRYIFYPEDKSFVNLDNANWQTRGALLHAIVHLQKEHNGKANAYRQELEADSITITLLRKHGATEEESTQYLKITNSPNMPELQSRLKAANQVPPKAVFQAPPNASFTVNCSNGCIEPCRINFSSTSENTHPDTKYLWNGQELGKDIKWIDEKWVGEYIMKLTVINPDGQKSECSKTVFVRKKTPPIPPSPQLNPFRFGLQVGLNYSPDYEFFSPRLGLTFSYHPDFWGIQTELNYVKRMSETSYFYSKYNSFWDDYDYYSSSSNYKIHTLELPIIIIFGRNREHKIGVNALFGVSISYGISGNVRYEEYAYFANGSEDYYTENYPIRFEFDDYQRTQIRGIFGITIGHEHFCWGGRVDADITGSKYFSPEISSYLMFKF